MSLDLDDREGGDLEPPILSPRLLVVEDFKVSIWVYG